ncbi:uncharacterized protein PRCAT00001183001 [Priceomyces carsonii]|uniref:uncharacterized protein n=1 Tax=Priceomyces carsonii TaxID=28549 RepID=UPI002ED8277B|nr:unnamed protein product [Priceomyces carsonii]
MAQYIEIVRNEISYVDQLLESVPFTPGYTPSQDFLNIYTLNYEKMNKLSQNTSKFPIDANRLLKLGISLGNLIKSLQQDEQFVQQKQTQQLNIMNSMASPRNKPMIRPDDSNPFTERSKPVPSLPQQPAYQIKFMKNLLIILKNFNIGYSRYPSTGSLRFKGLDGSLNQSSSTLNSNKSPIKLSSRQLLIEKLEINIELDNLFIYKILFQIISRIFKIIQDQLISNGNYEITPPIGSPVTDESSSIFSGSSSNSSESAALDGYLRLVKETLSRMILGIIEPFVQLILSEIVNGSVENEFYNLIKSL